MFLLWLLVFCKSLGSCNVSEYPIPACGIVMAQGHRRAHGVSTPDISNMRMAGICYLPPPSLTPQNHLLRHPQQEFITLTVIRLPALFDPPDLRAPECVDESSSNTPALTSATQPLKPCLRDPGQLPGDINTPFSPPERKLFSEACPQMCSFPTALT